MKVIILDGEQRSALAATRSLGRRGIEVLVGSESEYSLAGVSRYCRRRFRYPEPIGEHGGFLDALVGLAAEEEAFAVFPMTDVTSVAVLRGRERVEAVTRVPGVSLEVFERVSDKGLLFREAQRLGVPVPFTLFVEAPEQVLEVAGEIPFPAVLKPARSKQIRGEEVVEGKVRYARSLEELMHLVRHEPAFREPFLIQERIEGPGVGLFALCQAGRPVALFSHRRVREKPPSGGVSVLRESVALEPDAAEAAEKLLHHFHWEGVAMVEFKRDRRDGSLRLMEINGRFWGSLQLAIDSGVDFPFLLLQSLRGVELPRSPGYRAGVRSRWLLGDLDHLLLRLFRSAEALNLPAGYPSRLKCLLDFVDFSGRETHLEVCRLEDPRPFLHESRQYLRQLLAGKPAGEG